MVMTRKMKQLAEEYKEGIAEALGVSPEDINQEVVNKWVEDWAKAFLKPAVFYQMFDKGKVKENTKALVTHIVSVSNGGSSNHSRTRRKGL